MGSARLAILVSSDRRRGAEVFGETLAEGLGGEGWQVSLLSLTTAPDEPRVAAQALSSTPPDALPKLDRGVVMALRRWVVEHRPQVMLANGSSTMQYAVAALAMMRSRPRLVYVSIGEPMFWVRGRRHRALRTAILKGVDRVFSVSATTAHQLVHDLRVPSRKVRIAPTGVPERFFEIVADPAGDELRIVFIGNLSTEKDPMAALDIIAQVAAEHPVRARFLGGGPLHDRLAVEVTGRRLGDIVQVLGSVPDVAPHLAWADVLLLTSRTEGLPAVPLEAGAAGVPSVAYDVGGTAETVVDGRTGRLVAAGDVAAATKALGEIATDRHLAVRWGEAARAMVAERFTIPHAVARYAALLDDELMASSSAAREVDR